MEDKMQKELPQWARHAANAERVHGTTAHLACATHYSVYGAVDLTNRIERRPRTMRSKLRAITRDIDGAFRVHNRLDGKFIDPTGKLVQR